MNYKKHMMVIQVCVGLSLVAIASTSFADSLGTVASNLTKTFGAIGKLITAGSYIAGLAFSVGAIMKFKQHKDNPTQIPIGTPISLVLIAAALLFLPTLLDTIGSTMFGSSGARTAGPSGTAILNTSS